MPYLWRNNESKSLGVAVYNTSWGAPKADVHSQQRFHYMGHKGEVKADQAHRGYTGSFDEGGYASINPLFWRYTPDARGKFAGQNTYGYKSFENFSLACDSVNKNETTLEVWDAELATAASTLVVTAVLEAGRLSLDNDGSAINVLHDENGKPTELVVAHPKV